MTSSTRTLRLLAIGAWFAAAAQSALAQSPLDALHLGLPGAPEPCVSIPVGRIAYPADMLERKLAQSVLATMEFRSATDPPAVRFATAGPDGPFEQAVRARVERYRLPCFAGPQPVVVTQRVDFDPGDGRRVAENEPQDEATRREAELGRCVTGLQPLPEYPRSAIEAIKPGTVLVRYAFTAADHAPDVQILFNGGGARLEDAVRSYAGQLRMPCLAASDVPFNASQDFTFAMQGQRGTVLKDASLASFVRVLARLDEQHVRFDLGSMACPFDLRFQSRRPYDDNRVHQLETRDPRRKPLLDWLRKVEFDLPEATRARVTGDSMVLSVPCGVLDLS